MKQPETDRAGFTYQFRLISLQHSLTSAASLIESLLEVIAGARIMRL